MATFWNVEKIDKPWGKFDPKAQLDIPFKWTDWLTDLGLNYASHVITVEPPLQLVGSNQLGGIITAFVKVLDGESVNLNQKYFIECEITTDGTPPRKDNRRVYLKMVER
jgi:hypothetical protein